MDDFEVTVSIRNNHLKQRRVEAGLTQRQVAEKAGMSNISYSRIERMTVSPQRKDGSWRLDAVRLAEFWGVPEEELFPPEILKMNDRPSSVSKRLSGQFLTDNQQQTLEYENYLDQKVLANQLLETIPLYYRTALKLRFGIDTKNSLTLEELGGQLGVNRERARQIEAKALRMLRHPSRSGSYSDVWLDENMWLDENKVPHRSLWEGKRRTIHRVGRCPSCRGEISDGEIACWLRGKGADHRYLCLTCLLRMPSCVKHGDVATILGITYRAEKLVTAGNKKTCRYDNRPFPWEPPPKSVSKEEEKPKGIWRCFGHVLHWITDERGYGNARHILTTKCGYRLSKYRETKRNKSSLFCDMCAKRLGMKMAVDR